MFRIAAFIRFWNRFICIHHSQYSAGSYVDGLDDPAPFDLPIWFFLSTGSHAKKLQAVSYIVPLRYYLEILRALLMKGVGAGAIMNEIVALAVFGVLILGAAALRFRKRLD